MSTVLDEKIGVRVKITVMSGSNIRDAIRL